MSFEKTINIEGPDGDWFGRAVISTDHDEQSDEFVARLTVDTYEGAVDVNLHRLDQLAAIRDALTEAIEYLEEGVDHVGIA